MIIKLNLSFCTNSNGYSLIKTKSPETLMYRGFSSELTGGLEPPTC